MVPKVHTTYCPPGVPHPIRLSNPVMRVMIDEENKDDTHHNASYTLIFLILLAIWTVGKAIIR